MKRKEANEIRNTIIEECEKHQYCGNCPFFMRSTKVCSFSGTVYEWEKDGLYVNKGWVKYE